MLPTPSVDPYTWTDAWRNNHVLWYEWREWRNDRLNITVYYLHEVNEVGTLILAKVWRAAGQWQFSIKDRERAASIRQACTELTTHFVIERMGV